MYYHYPNFKNAQDQKTNETNNLMARELVTCLSHIGGKWILHSNPGNLALESTFLSTRNT